MRRGFTIVELLVVLGVLAVLAAILFPALSSARRSANDTLDVARMRQLATAVHLYNADADDLMPPGVNDRPFAAGWDSPPGFVGVKKPWATFADLMIPYTRNREMFRQSRSTVPVTLPKDHIGSDFVYDQWAGLRLFRASAVSGERSLLFPSVPEGADGRKLRVPCMRYDLATPQTLINVCEDRTTWWHD